MFVLPVRDLVTCPFLLSLNLEINSDSVKVCSMNVYGIFTGNCTKLLHKTSS